MIKNNGTKMIMNEKLTVQKEKSTVQKSTVQKSIVEKSIVEKSIVEFNDSCSMV